MSPHGIMMGLPDQVHEIPNFIALQQEVCNIFVVEKCRQSIGRTRISTDTLKQFHKEVQGSSFQWLQLGVQFCKTVSVSNWSSHVGNLNFSQVQLLKLLCLRN